MGTDRKGERFCDHCGRIFDKAVHVHLGFEYCRACYQTQFRRASCSKCAGPVRAHKLASDPVCGACERAERTCLRCGRLTPHAAKLIDGRAVCAGCVNQFAAERVCEGCGKKSRSVSRVQSSLTPTMAEETAVAVDTGNQLLCRPCRTRLTHATCSICSRHRNLWSVGSSGKAVCRTCAGPEPATHACPGCGVTVAGSGLGRCMPCILHSAASRRSRLLSTGLERAWCRDMWEGFVEQVLQTNAYLPKASRLLTSAISYFQLIESAYREPGDLTVATLHEGISSPVHRRHLLAYRFVLESLGSDAADGASEARAQANEARRLKVVLARASGRPYASLLEGFVDSLRSAGKAERTIRLYAGVAQAFCDRAAVTSERPWAPNAVVEYLKHTPGAAASLSAFITFCRERQQWGVSMPNKAARRADQARADRTVDRLHKAMAKVRGKPVDGLKLLDVVRVISAATGLPMNKLAGMRLDVVPEAGKSVVLGEEARIDPGHLLYPYAVRWQQLIAARAAVAR